MLDDGTGINVNTSQPDKNGITYADSVDVINGNDHVKISDMDKGAGKVGDVTEDGRQHAQDFAGKTVFKEDKNASHWSKDGKEVVAGDKNGEYKLGKDV